MSHRKSLRVDKQTNHRKVAVERLYVVLRASFLTEAAQLTPGLLFMKRPQIIFGGTEKETLYANLFNDDEINQETRI